MNKTFMQGRYNFCACGTRKVPRAVRCKRCALNLVKHQYIADVRRSPLITPHCPGIDPALAVPEDLEVAK